MPKIEVQGLEAALAAVAERPAEENRANYEHAYSMMVELVERLGEDMTPTEEIQELTDKIAHLTAMENKVDATATEILELEESITELKERNAIDPCLMDEFLSDKEIATKVVLFYAHAPVETQADVDAHARLFDAYFRTVGRRGEDCMLRAYLMRRTFVVYKAVFNRSSDDSGAPLLRLCSLKKSQIPDSIKDYCDKLRDGRVPERCPPEEVMLSWVGYVTRTEVLQQMHGLFASVSTEWTLELVQQMLGYYWNSSVGASPLRILDLGCGRTPWVAKALLLAAESVGVNIEMTCIDSGDAQPQCISKMSGVDVIMESALDAVRTRGKDTDVILISWPLGYSEDFRLLECLYQFSVNRGKPARVIYVGEPYSERHVNMTCFTGWKELFTPEFFLDSYRSWAGYRDVVCGGYFVPRCQNSECHKATVSLRKCKRCNKRWYCSTECQTEDWARKSKPEAAHRHFCSKEDK